MIKVGFVSIFYPLFMGRYILEAFLRRSDCQVWTAGPFTGRWIPWRGGMNLPQEYVYTPNYPIPFGGQPSLSWKMVENRPDLPWEPDIWVNVSSTLVTHGRPIKGKYAVVAADPHVLDYTDERNKADYFFNMQKPYMKPGDIWLPYAYDPIWHAQTTIPAAERQHDAALIGLPYPDRGRLVSRLRNDGLDVFYDIGPCYDEARAIYHNTRVGLNWSSLQDTTARVFELMAFGICPVLNRVPDLMELFTEGEHFLGFGDLNEAAQKAEMAAKDFGLCERIGNAARNAVEPHSWDARVQKILEVAELVPVENA